MNIEKNKADRLAIMRNTYDAHYSAGRVSVDLGSPRDIVLINYHYLADKGLINLEYVKGVGGYQVRLTAKGIEFVESGAESF